MERPGKEMRKRLRVWRAGAMIKADLEKRIRELECENHELTKEILEAKRALEENSAPALTEEEQEAILRMKQWTYIVRMDTMHYCAKCLAWQKGMDTPNYCHACGRPFKDYQV